MQQPSILKKLRELGPVKPATTAAELIIGYRLMFVYPDIEQNAFPSAFGGIHSSVDVFYSLEGVDRFAADYLRNHDETGDGALVAYQTQFEANLEHTCELFENPRYSTIARLRTPLHAALGRMAMVYSGVESFAPAPLSPLVTAGRVDTLS